MFTLNGWTSLHTTGLWIGLIVYLIGALADTYTTRKAMSIGLKESNPVFGKHASLLELIGYKAAFLVFASVIYWFGAKDNGVAYHWLLHTSGLSLFGLIGCAIAYWNNLQIQKQIKKLRK